MTVVQDSDVPAPGQLVTVRNRIWVASDVVQGSITGADDTVLTGRAPHVVRNCVAPAAST